MKELQELVEKFGRVNIDKDGFMWVVEVESSDIAYQGKNLKGVVSVALQQESK